jgi:hypothetical protein
VEWGRAAVTVLPSAERTPVSFGCHYLAPPYSFESLFPLGPNARSMQEDSARARRVLFPVPAKDIFAFRVQAEINMAPRRRSY